ncbi:chemotaxis protein CheW [Oceanidesulfovibrio marinus]|nr:chemotaxis protein CheW [Oceanidesulfovibrio marinus]
MSANESRKYLTFTLADEIFAFEISSVREIQDVADITRIPHSPAYMRGVVNLRGAAIPVMDLREKFGLGRTEHTINTRIVIVVIDNEDGESIIGALADSVREVLELENDQIDAPPKMGASIHTGFLKGVARQDNEFILVLDSARVFSSGEVEEAVDEAAVAHEAVAA